MRTAVLILSLALAAPAAQADLAALFDQGREWEPWLADVRSQRQTWLQVLEQARPSDDLVSRLRAVSASLKLLVVAEATCSDSVQSVPHIAALARAAGVPLKIVSKAPAENALDSHRTPDGRTATPTVILLRDGRDAGAWVERPAPLQVWMLAHGHLSTQERLGRKTGWYQWDRGETALAEIVALAERRAAVAPR